MRGLEQLDPDFGQEKPFQVLWEASFGPGGLGVK